MVFLIIHFLLLVIFSFLLTAVLCTASVFRHAPTSEKRRREKQPPEGRGGKKKPICEPPDSATKEMSDTDAH